MRSRFHQELDDLRARLLRMGGLAEQAVDRACQAYIDRDLNRCHQVLEGETQINLTEREIDEMAFDLLAMNSQWLSIYASFSQSPRLTPTSSVSATRRS